MIAVSLLLLVGQALALDCTAASFRPPVAAGVKVLSLTADLRKDFGSAGNDVCYLNITITHPGTGDGVNNYYALPTKNYNDRFQGQGGGGWAAGNPLGLFQASALGYAAGTTDAGHELTIAAAQDANPWALVSPGNVDQYALLNFARRSVHDMTVSLAASSLTSCSNADIFQVIGKQIAEQFYGKAPCKSYWSGCSNGGRQGLQAAQYYPADYDGILADAPAIQWTALLT